MDKFYKGLYTAQLTPFKNNNIDIQSFITLLNIQLDAKVDGIVVGGSTGEVAVLALDEYKLLLKTAYPILNKKTQLIAGISANTPNKALEIAKIAEDSGADGLMCVMPYYNKPPQRGLVKYFETIHNHTKLPIMLYSVPSRTGVDFSDETIIELSKLDRIVALKDSAADIERPLRLQSKLPKNFSLLSGEDSNTMAYSAHGGVGCVSVISNIAPQICKKLQNLLQEGNYQSALQIQSRLIDLYKAIFIDTNPIPIKFAASFLNLCKEDVRAPLVRIEDEQVKNQIKQVITILKNDLNLS